MIDASSLMTLSTIALPEDAMDLARSPDGAFLYATHLVGDTISQISTASNAIVATFSTPDPGGIGVSPDGSRLYVVRMGQQQVLVLDSVSGATLAAVSTTLTKGAFSRGTIVVSATTAYVSDLGSAVVFLDIASNTVRLAPVNGSPAGIALSADGRQLFTATNAGVVTLDSTTGAVLGSFPTVSAAVVVAVLPPLPCLYEVAAPPSVPLSGGTVNLSIPAPSTCSWSATTAADWLSITPSLSGTGPATLSVIAAAAAAPRSTTVQIGAQVIPITQTSPEIHVDLPDGQTLTEPAVVTGWAIDRVDGATRTSLPGVDAIHVWAYPLPAGEPIFVGTAAYGLHRPDVVAVFGPRYDASGFSATIRGLPAGAYNLVFFAHSARSGTFAATALVAATVRRAPAQIVIDAPVSGATVRGTFPLVGWAIDAGAAVAPGIDAVDVWAYPASGAPPQFVGSATYGQSRPDVGLALGAQFTRSGFTLNATGLLPGSYQLAVFPRSSDTHTFNPAAVVPIIVAGSAPLMFVDAPVANTAIHGAFSVDGWALDLSAGTGSGVDAVHIWAYPAAGGAALFVGVATAVPRPDVGAAFGTQYALSGFHLGGATLPAGAYDLVVFARSTLAGAFNNAVVVRITVQ